MTAMMTPFMLRAQRVHMRRWLVVLVAALLALGAVVGVFVSVRVTPPAREEMVRYRAPTAVNLTCCGPHSPWRCVASVHGAAAGSGSQRYRIGFVTVAAASARGMVPNLWRSIQEHAFPGHEVHMYVLSDVVDSPEYAGLQRLHVRPLVAMEPPFDVLGVHAAYLSNFDWFTGLDFIFAIDVRTAVVAALGDLLLGERVATLSAWHVDQPLESLGYDRRLSLDSEPFSSAYVAEREGGCYFAGELFGGTRHGFGEILRHAVQLFRADVDAVPSRAAILMDESYLNRVFIDLPPTVVLAHNFMFPKLLSVLHPAQRAASRIVGTSFFPHIVYLGDRRGALGEGVSRAAVVVPTALKRSPGTARVLSLPRGDVHDTAGITFVVRSFERPLCLRQLLDSLSVVYRGARVCVLDDSITALLAPEDLESLRRDLNVTYVRTEYDIGISEARNRLVRLVSTKYVAFLGDNMELDSASDVRQLVGMLDSNRADIVGGCVDGELMEFAGSQLINFGGVVRQRHELRCRRSTGRAETDSWRRPEFSTPDASCWLVDMPLDYFVGRVSTLQKLQWDTSFTQRSHEDFFLGAKVAGARVAMCRGVYIKLSRTCTHGRDSVDRRGRDEWAVLLRKWSLTEWQTPASSMILQCSSGEECKTDTSSRDVTRHEEDMGGTSVVCCDQSSPWVCSTGGRPAGNLSAAAMVSRYTRLRIGFVTFASGAENRLALNLWASLQDHVFTRHDIHLFVFTDNEALYSGEDNIHTRPQGRDVGSFDSLGRHFLFLEHIDWFSGVDYLFSVNAYASFVGVMDESALGERVASLNAWYFGLPRREYTYEARLTSAGTPLSKAYVSKSEGLCYFASGMFGGTVDGVRTILESVVRQARSDLSSRPPRIALWQDESYINRAFIDLPPTVVLAPVFMYPESPVDAWLYVQEPGAHAWHVPVGASRRFSPRVINLVGQRNPERSSSVELGSRRVVIPAFMTLSGAPGALPLPLARGQRLDELTFIVKAFERPDCLRRLLKSLGDVYPGANVIVIDDSMAALLPGDEASALAQLHELNFTYVRTEHDIGLAAGRNRLVDLVRTPYAALLDDDSILDGTENIMHLVTALEAGGFDIAGGCVRNPKYGPGWSYSLSHTGDRLVITPDVVCAAGEPASRPPDFDTTEVACWKSSLILNFFVGRVEALRDRVRWDPRLKLGEHEDFFLRAQKNGLSVALCRGISVLNDHSCDASVVYATSRARVFVYWSVFFETWSLREMQTAAGLYRLKCEAATAGNVALAGSEEHTCVIEQVNLKAAR